MWHLSEALRAQNRLNEAEHLGRHALDHFEAKLGADHEWTGWGLIGLAKTCLEQGNATEVAELASRAATLIERVYGPEHVVLATALCLRGRALLDLQQEGEGAMLLERALSIQVGAGEVHAEDAARTRDLLQRVRQVATKH
jgi:hypothetical protein